MIKFVTMAIALQAIKAEEIKTKEMEEIDKNIYLAIYLVVGVTAFLLLAYYSYELYVDRLMQIRSHDDKVAKIQELADRKAASAAAAAED